MNNNIHLNALTIDVEDYWSIFSRDWLKLPLTPTDSVVRNTEWLLEKLSEKKVRATFFILGEIAQSFPHLIKKIAAESHEIAVHGFYHRQIFKLSKDDFRKEIGDAKKLLEDLSGQKIVGHRAPAFSINKDTKWALEVLAELGFNYDSSISPMAGKRYGWPGFKREIHKMQMPNGQSIIEVPMSTISLGIKELGIGGGYMRHLPYFYTKWAIGHIQKKRPAIIYMHPYEIDMERREINLQNLNKAERRKTRMFHMLQMRNRNSMKGKIIKLISQFYFAPLIEVVEKSVNI